MSLYGAFAKENHFSELADPLDIGGTVISPTTRKQRALAALGLGGGATTTSTGGTVTTAATTTAAEFFDGALHITEFTMAAFALGNSGDNANLAIGAKFYTLPAGAYVIEGCTIVGGVTAAISVTTDTPEAGVGTTIGTGATATLSTTMEDIVDGGAAGLIGGALVAPDVAGTLFAKGMLSTSVQGVYIAASGGKSHDLFLNVADGWADVTAAGAVTFTGKLTLKWRKVA